MMVELTMYRLSMRISGCKLPRGRRRTIVSSDSEVDVRVAEVKKTIFGTVSDLPQWTKIWSFLT
jgi:hypothetical protein